MSIYIEQARRSPLAFGPKSSNKTKDFPKTLYSPVNGKKMSVHIVLDISSLFAIFPAIPMEPNRVDRSPSLHKPTASKLQALVVEELSKSIL